MQDGLTWFQPRIRLCQSPVARVYAIISLSAQLLQYMAVVRSKGNPDLRYSAPTKILYAEAGVVNFDMKHHRVELAPVAMVHTV